MQLTDPLAKHFRLQADQKSALERLGALTEEDVE